MSGRKTKADRGLFRRRGSPHWWIRYADRNGRIRRESTNSTEKGLARDILSKKKVLVAENRHLDVKRIPRCTFSELCDRYWKTDGQHKKMHGLEGMLKAFKAGFGSSTQLIEITTEKVERFLSERIEVDGVSIATRNRDRAILSILFNKAIKWDLLTANPVRESKRFKENNKRTRFLDKEEIDRLLVACEPKPKDHKKAKREKRLLKNLVILAVQELLGHADLRMTERYCHLSADHRSRAVSILDSAYQTDTKSDTMEKQGPAARS